MVETLGPSKDALELTSGGGVARNCPVVPGIDLTGEVVESQSPDFDRRRQRARPRLPDSSCAASRCWEWTP